MNITPRIFVGTQGGTRPGHDFFRVPRPNIIKSLIEHIKSLCILKMGKN